MAEDDLPTHHPAFNVDDPVYQATRDRIEAARFGDPSAIDAFHRDVPDAYRTARRARLIQIVTQFMLKRSGTQQDLADLLGIDRSCISVAKDFGELGSGPLSDMFADESLLKFLIVHRQRVSGDLGRCGFIAAARHAYALWYGFNRESVELSVPHYEELCRLLPQSLAGEPAEPAWRDVFVYVFATVEGIGEPSLWWPPDLP